MQVSLLGSSTLDKSRIDDVVSCSILPGKSSSTRTNANLFNVVKEITLLVFANVIRELLNHLTMSSLFLEFQRRL